MAIETIGGRDYYTRALSTTVGTSFVDVPTTTKAILFPAEEAFVFNFESTEITMTPSVNQVVNLIPNQIKRSSSSGTIYFLF